MTEKIEIGMAIMDGGKVIGVATFDSDERLTKMMADSAKRGLTVKTMNVKEAKRQMAENYEASTRSASDSIESAFAVVKSMAMEEVQHETADTTAQ